MDVREVYQVALAAAGLYLDKRLVPTEVRETMRLRCEGCSEGEYLEVAERYDPTTSYAGRVRAAEPEAPGENAMVDIPRVAS